MTPSELPPKCDRCPKPAAFVVAGTGLMWTARGCSAHLADRISYGLGLCLRVDVRRVEVTS